MLSENGSANAYGGLGIYVHIPYCLRKCRYCDFVSFPRAPEDSYFEALAEDVRKAAELLRLHKLDENYYSVNTLKSSENDPLAVDSVFFGGGTPSLASEGQLGIVLSAVREAFNVADDAEISIEANPETVSEQKAAELKRLGFNRVSMGVQSLDDDVLSALDRVHSADRARDAFDILRGAGFDNINLDLMFGTPRDSVDGSPRYMDLEIWHHTLDEIFAMKPEHISFYSLQLEEGTPLYRDYSEGLAELPPWEENRRMYHSAVELLKEKGYHHYEVSNAARPGFECRHNIKYWTMQPYLGFGTSAHSFLPLYGQDGLLCGGLRGEISWRSFGTAQSSGAISAEESVSELKGDYIFTQLRLIKGTDPQLYHRLFGSDFIKDFGGPLSELEREGSVSISGGSVRLTSQGLDRTNLVMERLLSCIR